jgi:putative flippase GtrA
MLGNRFSRLAEIIRFYQAGVVNTLLGLGVYAIFVRLGLHPYLAHILSYIIGMVFNYLTYSRHVFREAGPAKLRFFLAYLGGYPVSIGSLAVARQFIASPYLAGLAAIFLVSIINYVVLKYLVFIRKRALT